MGKDTKESQSKIGKLAGGTNKLVGKSQEFAAKAAAPHMTKVAQATHKAEVKTIKGSIATLADNAQEFQHASQAVAVAASEKSKDSTVSSFFKQVRKMMGSSTAKEAEQTSKEKESKEKGDYAAKKKETLNLFTTLVTDKDVKEILLSATIPAVSVAKLVAQNPLALNAIYQRGNKLMEAVTISTNPESQPTLYRIIADPDMKRWIGAHHGQIATLAHDVIAKSEKIPDAFRTEAAGNMVKQWINHSSPESLQALAVQGMNVMIRNNAALAAVHANAPTSEVQAKDNAALEVKIAAARIATEQFAHPESLKALKTLVGAVANQDAKPLASMLADAAAASKKEADKLANEHYKRTEDRKEVSVTMVPLPFLLVQNVTAESLQNVLPLVLSFGKTCLDAVQPEDMGHLSKVGTLVDPAKPDGATYLLPNETRNRLITAAASHYGLQSLEKLVNVLESEQCKIMRQNIAEFATMQLHERKINVTGTFVKNALSFGLKQMDEVLKDQANHHSITELARAVEHTNQAKAWEQIQQLVKNKAVEKVITENLPAFLRENEKEITKLMPSLIPAVGSISPKAIGGIMPHAFKIASQCMNDLKAEDVANLTKLGTPIDPNNPNGEKHSLSKDTRDRLIGALTSGEGLANISNAVQVVRGADGISVREAIAAGINSQLDKLVEGSNAQLASQAVEVCTKLADLVLQDENRRNDIKSLGKLLKGEHNVEAFKSIARILKDEEVKDWVKNDLTILIRDNKEQIGHLLEEGAKKLQGSEIYMKGVAKEDLAAIAENHSLELLELGRHIGKNSYFKAFGKALGMFTTDATVRKVVGQVVGNAFDHMISKAVNAFKGGKDTQVAQETQQQKDGVLRPLGKAANIKKKAEEKAREEHAEGHDSKTIGTRSLPSSVSDIGSKNGAGMGGR